MTLGVASGVQGPTRGGLETLWSAYMGLFLVRKRKFVYFKWGTKYEGFFVGIIERMVVVVEMQKFHHYIIDLVSS